MIDTMQKSLFPNQCIMTGYPLRISENDSSKMVKDTFPANLSAASNVPRETGQSSVV